MNKTILLDAMGVIYESADDVRELLIPFLRGFRCEFADHIIEDLYVKCSIGKCSTDFFWSSLLPGQELPFDMIYTKEHNLREGAVDFLKQTGAMGLAMGCLSNDTSEWAMRLCERFSLDNWIEHWFISGDIGVRKPDLRIYSHILDHISGNPDDLILVDDREANLDAAASLGITCIHFNDKSSGKYPSVDSFAGLSNLIFEEVYAPMPS